MSNLDEAIEAARAQGISLAQYVANEGKLRLIVDALELDEEDLEWTIETNAKGVVVAWSEPALTGALRFVFFAPDDFGTTPMAATFHAWADRKLYAPAGDCPIEQGAVLPDGQPLAQPDALEQLRAELGRPRRRRQAAVVTPEEIGKSVEALCENLCITVLAAMERSGLSFEEIARRAGLSEADLRIKLEEHGMGLEDFVAVGLACGVRWHFASMPV